jgi:hypothetical protein
MTLSPEKQKPGFSNKPGFFVCAFSIRREPRGAVVRSQRPRATSRGIETLNKQICEFG